MIPQIARLKVYAQRGTTYLNLGSQAMVLRLFLVGQGIHSWLAFAALLVLTAAIILGLMYLEDRAGVFEAETEMQWSRSPQLRAIMAAFDESLEQSEESV